MRVLRRRLPGVQVSDQLRALYLKIAERLRRAADDYERRANEGRPAVHRIDRMGIKVDGVQLRDAPARTLGETK